jgi:hypothetical protein
MHSKFDFFTLENDLSIYSASLGALFTKEPYIEHFVIERWRNRGETRFYFGVDITPEWVENNLQSLALFGNSDQFVILQAEMISSAGIQALSSVEFDGQELLLCFSRKSDYFGELKKSELWECATIDAPPFWHDGELLRFFCQKNEVVLAPEAFNFVLSALVASIDEFSNLTKQLALIFGANRQQNITLEELKSVVSPVKLDQFHLLTLLAQKNRVQFLQEVTELKPDLKMLEELCRLVCSHFIKLADVSYMDKKKRLSSYDKKIAAHAKLWTLSDIEKVIEFFGHLTYLARSRDPSVLNCLREVLLLNIGMGK